MTILEEIKTETSFIYKIDNGEKTPIEFQWGKDVPEEIRLREMELLIQS